MTRWAAMLALACLSGAASAADSRAVRELADRAAIADTMQKYVWSVDSLDADGYVSVFTPDARIDSNGSVIEGHAAIRKVVTDLEARQASYRAQGKPAGLLYHVISNEWIEFQGAASAVYHSYWQTMRKGEDGRYATGGFGRSEDHLSRQKDGRWLITSRKLTVFTE
jgi:hypothetical protein